MSYKVLIVEDLPELLEAMSDFYREKGAGLWDVVSASDGKDALAKVTGNDFDLMILDIMLPGASGFDICKAARSKGDCPIIFVTALGSENSILKGYETGCDDYVVKPFSLKQLYAKSLGLLKRAKKSQDSDILSCGSISLNKRTMLVKVNNILQFSRSENSSVPLSKSEVKVAEIIHGIISDNEQKISEKGLKVEFDEKSAPVLNTDKELFRQAMGNLINNAVLYAKADTSVIIECNDEGIKITNVMAEPIDDISKLKEPFVKGSSSRENGGTGLGLAIAENDLAILKYKLNVKTENDLFVCMVGFK